MADSYFDKFYNTGGYDSGTKGKAAPHCYESHPGLPLPGGFTIYGGACGYPIHEDADVYVALQSGYTSGLTSDPWDEQKVHEIHYGITDMGVPKDIPRFNTMIDWLVEQIKAGKKVHVGCIGGHGRTGTVLSAIAAKMGVKDPIAYVRKHYCKKAVENDKQVKFLVKHFGTDSPEGYKSHLKPLPMPSKKYSSSQSTLSLQQEPLYPQNLGGMKTIPPVQGSMRSLWRRK